MGKVTVHVLEAQSLHDSQTFGKQDPYVLVELGSTHYRGKTITDGGVKPTFNQKYEFEYNPKLPALIQVSIFNSNSITSDDLLGTVEVPLGPVLSKHHEEVNASVVRKSGKVKGSLHLILQFEPTPGSQPQAAAPSANNTELEKIRAMFQKYDQDSNGGIDKREFHLLLQELGFFKDMPVDKQQKLVHAQFDAADTSKDGWLDFNEFAAMYNRLIDAMLKHPKANAYVPPGAAFINPTAPPAPAPAPALAPPAPAPAPAAPAYPPAAAPAYPPAAAPAYPPAATTTAYPVGAVAYPPAYPNNNVPAYPGGVPGYGAPQQYGQPQQFGAPPQQYGGAPVMQYGRPPAQLGMPPASYGAPQYAAAPMQQQAYYGAPQQHKPQHTGGMGGGMGMMMGLGGGLVAGMLLDDLFD